MSIARLIEVADAVTRLINQGEFDLKFEAKRRHFVRLDLDKLGDDLHVAVVPSARTTANLDRAHVLHDVQVMIGVQRRISADEDAAVDALMALTEAVEAHIRRAALPAADGQPLEHIRWRSSELTTPLSSEHLDARRTFLAILTITYAVKE
jgi:hypothetical protein